MIDVGVLLNLLAGLVGGVLVYLSNRFIAKSSKEVGQAQVEVERRKVDQEAFDRFVRELDKERTGLRDRLVESEKKQIATDGKLERLNHLLVLAVVSLKKTRQAVLDGKELPPFPDELKQVQTWHYDDEMNQRNTES